MSDTNAIIKKANELGYLIPAFNVAYLPMTEPIIQAVTDQDSFSLVEVSRVDWEKMEAKSYQAVYEEYMKYENKAHVRLHLDHVPVIDEDGLEVDYLAIVKDAVAMGYQSVMVDASRLSLEGNIKATAEVAEIAHAKDVPVEAELGAVLGHEAGPPPPYEELFASGKGFTKVDEAARFVRESGCDWLSVAIGNIHGSISDALKDQKKPDARLNLEHLQKLADATGIPLVLHGGSGVQQQYTLDAAKIGITKINVGTEIRQAYEKTLKATSDVVKAQQAVYDSVTYLVKDYYKIAGIQKQVMA